MRPASQHNRDRDLGTGIDALHAPNHAFGRLHGHAANPAFANVLLNFQNHVDRLRDDEPFAGHTQRW